MLYFYMSVTCIETLLKDPPMTPAIASGLSSCKAYDPSGQMNSELSTFASEALTNSKACKMVHQIYEKMD